MHLATAAFFTASLSGADLAAAHALIEAWPHALDVPHAARSAPCPQEPGSATTASSFSVRAPASRLAWPRDHAGTHTTPPQKRTTSALALVVDARNRVASTAPLELHGCDLAVRHRALPSSLPCVLHAPLRTSIDHVLPPHSVLPLLFPLPLLPDADGGLRAVCAASCGPAAAVDAAVPAVLASASAPTHHAAALPLCAHAGGPRADQCELPPPLTATAASSDTLGRVITIAAAAAGHNRRFLAELTSADALAALRISLCTAPAAMLTMQAADGLLSLVRLVASAGAAVPLQVSLSP